MAEDQAVGSAVAAGEVELRPLQIEMNGINVISDSERKGHPRDLFWPWFAANHGQKRSCGLPFRSASEITLIPLASICSGRAPAALAEPWAL